MNKRKIKKLVRLIRTAFISVIVILAMVLNFSEKAVIGAIEAYNNRPINKVHNLTEKYDSSKSKTLYELKEYRDIDKKVFLNDQGIAELSIYGDAVHYYKNGEYKDIDNTLVYNKESKSYTNVDNFYHSTFPEDIKDNRIEIVYDKYKISYGLKEINNSNINKINNINSDNSDIKNLSKVTSGVLYKEIQKNVDLQYTLQGKSIKEDIILKEYIKDFSIVFNYELDNLKLIEEDGHYLFVNEFYEVISEFTDLIMIDAKGNVSNGVYLKVVSKNENSYEISMTVDDKFLKEASYPVIIDPTIDLSTSGLSIQNKYIYRDNSTGEPYVYNNPTYLQIKRNENGRYISETYFGLNNIKSSLSNLGFIYEAKLNLSVTSTALFTGSCKIALSEVLNYTYNDLDTYPLNPAIDSYSSDLISYTTGTSSMSFDITNTVYNWLYNGTNSSVLRLQGGIGSLSNFEINFYGVSVPAPSMRPLITVDYRPETGMVPYQDYSSYESSVGTLFVNNYSLQSIFSFNDYVYSSENTNLNISHVFNNSRKFNKYGYGQDWNLNLNKEFTYTPSIKEMLNADGYYVQFSEDSSTEGIAKDGSGLKYEYLLSTPVDEFGEAALDGNHTIYVTTQDDIRYEFRKFLAYPDYKLVKIYNTNQEDSYTVLQYKWQNNCLIMNNVGLYFYDVNEQNYDKTININLYYSPVSNVPLYKMEIEKMDNSGNPVLIQRSEYQYESNKLKYVYNNYDFDLDGQLTSDNTVTFFYNSDSDLWSIYKSMKDEIRVDYSSFNRVKKVEYYNGAYLTNRNEFKSSPYCTSITDKNGKEVNRFYDFFGKYTGSDSMYKVLDNITYNNSEDNYNTINKIVNTSTIVENNANLIKNGEFEESALTSWTIYNSGSNISELYTCRDLFDGSLTIEEKELYKAECQQRVNSGQKSLHLKQNQYSTIYLRQEVNVDVGYYSVSAYINNLQSNNISIIVSGSNISSNSFVKLQNDSNKNMDLYRIVFKSNAIQAVNVYIQFKTTSSVGESYVDDIKLSTQVGKEMRNLVINSSFENGTIGYTKYPTPGTFATTTGELTNDQTIIMGKNSLVYSTSTSTSSYISQKIYLSALDNVKSFAFGGSVKTRYESVSGSKTTITLRGVDENNNTQDFVLENNQYINDAWQQLYATVTFDNNLKFLEIIIKSYDLDYGITLLDNLFVYDYVEENKYEYDNRGNVTKITDKNDNTSVMSYDDNDNLISYRSSLDTTYVTNSEYDENNELICTYVQIQQYDEFGEPIYNKCISDQNIRKVTINKDGVYTFTKTSYYYNGVEYTREVEDEYTKYRNHIKATTDQEGNTIQYDIDDVTELVNQIIEPNSAITDYTYDDFGRIKTITKHGTTIKYYYDPIDGTLDAISVNENTAYVVWYYLTYDSMGRLQDVNIGSTNIITNTYLDDGDFDTYLLDVSSLSNGTSYKYEYDNDNRLIKVQYKTSSMSVYSDKFKYEYDYNGLLIKYIEFNSGVSTTYTFTYDANGRLATYSKNGLQYSYLYDNLGSLIQKVITINNYTSKMIYSYDYSKNRLNFIDYTINEGLTSQYNFKKVYEYEHEKLDRFIGYSIKSSTGANILSSYLDYNDNDTSHVISDKIYSESHKNNSNSVLYGYTYEYNNMSYIKKVINNIDNSYITYEYDLKGQLQYERRFNSNGTLIYKNQYGYDINGNINYKYYFICDTCSPSTITSYNYNSANWKDQLSTIRNVFGGTQYNIVYDAIGNPTTYKYFTFGYEGRNLVSASTPGTSMSFTYNNQNIRTSKTVGGITTNYQLDGNKIMSESKGTVRLYYNYDDNGNLVSLTYNEGSTYETYFYVLNMLGDVVGLIDKNGFIVASYDYDAYGNLIGTTDPGIESLNPFRYRSYYYDSDLGLYYLNSRYYDSTIGRFISADSHLNHESNNLCLNLYAYCDNNPVIYNDHDGKSLLLALLITALVITVAGVTYGEVTGDVIVLDLSYFSLSRPGLSNGIPTKFGVSMLLDFKSKNIEFYSHTGAFYGSPGISYSVGIVKNYENPGDYKGLFIDYGLGYYIGYDECFDPTVPSESAVSAKSITVSSSPGLYFGTDYYYYHKDLNISWAPEYTSGGR